MHTSSHHSPLSLSVGHSHGSIRPSLHVFLSTGWPVLLLGPWLRPFVPHQQRRATYTQDLEWLSSFPHNHVPLIPQWQVQLVSELPMDDTEVYGATSFYSTYRLTSIIVVIRITVVLTRWIGASLCSRTQD
ncbi:hypothetical protein PV04_03243 [Phialophora macrospora]|uniref:Uncharacterized protein n=1 Tax=Phialophora macrospora TaxID=1851006 RepID=A0A0D2E9Q8_9EURO|nr:hypothetical protein PV04_03243 [Phialophora macrospora]